MDPREIPENKPLFRLVKRIEDEIESLNKFLQEVLDEDKRAPDPDKGKVVWPIPDGAEIAINDAYATLFELSESEIHFTAYDETGNTNIGNLALSVSTEQLWDSAPPYFWRTPIKKALEEAWETYCYNEPPPPTDKSSSAKTQRLIKALLDAYNKWEENGA